MTRRSFDDANPVYWDIKGGRHNSLARHRGEHGLWYMIERRGQGRWLRGWTLHVFPDSVRVSGYAGRYFGRVLTEALMSHCIYTFNGSGGFDTGKSAMSRGGFRPSQQYPYSYEGTGFESGLIHDGDDFLRQVVGIEPTPDDLAKWAKEKQEAEEAARKAEEERKAQREAEFKARMEAERAAKAEAKAGFEAVFTQVEVPEGFFFEITHEGLKVWRERSQTVFGSNRYDQSTLKTAEDYQKWLVETQAKLQREADEAERRAVERAEREAEQKAREEQLAAEEAAIENHLAELDDLLSGL